MEKKLSIIVPVYNVEKYIDRCLDSLVKQTIDNYEVIIVVDGSKDASIDIAKKYRNMYPKLITLYETENNGLSAARNYGYDEKYEKFNKKFNYLDDGEASKRVVEYVIK